MTHPVTYDSLNDLDFTDAELRAEFDHEEVMVEEGRVRYMNRLEREKQRGNAASTTGTRSVVAQLVVPMADVIVDEISRLEDGRVKRKPPEVRTLKLLPARDTALLSLRATLNALASRSAADATRQRVAFAIGHEIEAEHLARLFKKDERGLFDHLMRKLEARTSNPAARRREIVETYARVSDDDSATIANTDKVRLGAWLLSVIELLGVVKSSRIMKGKRATTIYEVTSDMLNLVQEADDRASVMAPQLYPTIIQPRPWTSIKSGGYWMPFKGSGLVVARTRTNGIKRANEDEMPGVFGPVNYLQNTPWQINPHVLAVVRQMRRANMTCASLPPSELLSLPAKPHDIETNEEARSKYRREAREVHTRNAALKGRILAAEKTLLVAESMSDRPAIYFPKVIDFRGRVYDSPAYLKPQGDDLSKGLLRFANGKRIGARGREWLAIHGANVWGEDKVSLADRQAWVRANEGTILRIAADPFAERMWLDADKPFQFLAWCYEWAGVVAEGDDYVSHLPVAMDGTCNGLQHLSAMLRDPVGGRAVNLIPSDKPQDIYTEVLKVVIDELEERAGRGEPTAQAWLPLVNRKAVKRPVMTLPYGATRTGFADQIMEDTLRPLQRDGETPFQNPYEAAQYLGQIVWEATGSVVVAAREIMDWLQEVARIVATEGEPIRWTTPTGFVVVQDYRKSKHRQVELLCAGQRLQVRVADGHNDKIDRPKMKLAVAPNFVHAMDAAHMLRTVGELLDRVGPSAHLSMIHDSYGTHAADAEDMAEAIRAAFVCMYEDRCWLASFRDEVAEQLSPEAAETLPPVPEAASLDIGDVANSLYFFA